MTDNLVRSMPRGSAAFRNDGTALENRNCLSRRTLHVIRERYHGNIDGLPIANPEPSYSLRKQKLSGVKPLLTDDLIALLRKEDALGVIDIAKAILEDSEKSHLVHVSVRSDAVVPERDPEAIELQLSVRCSRLITGIDNLVHHRGRPDLVDLRDQVVGIEARASMLMNPERDSSMIGFERGVGITAILVCLLLIASVSLRTIDLERGFNLRPFTEPVSPVVDAKADVAPPNVNVAPEIGS